MTQAMFPLKKILEVIKYYEKYKVLPWNMVYSMYIQYVCTVSVCACVCVCVCVCVLCLCVCMLFLYICMCICVAFVRMSLYVCAVCVDICICLGLNKGMHINMHIITTEVHTYQWSTYLQENIFTTYVNNIVNELVQC